MPDNVTELVQQLGAPARATSIIRPYEHLLILTIILLTTYLIIIIIINLSAQMYNVHIIDKFIILQ